MKFRSLSEAKIELGTLIRLAERGETVVISRHGKPAVRLTPVGEEDFQLSAADASKLNAWADAERRQDGLGLTTAGLNHLKAPGEQKEQQRAVKLRPRRLSSGL